MNHRLSALILWKHYGEIPRIQRDGGKLISALETASKKHPELQDAAKKLRNTFNAPFHREASPQTAALFCLSELSKGDHLHQEYYWKLLGEVFRKGQFPKNSQRALFDLARKSGNASPFWTNSKKVNELYSPEELREALRDEKRTYSRKLIWGALVAFTPPESLIEFTQSNHPKDFPLLLDRLLENTPTELEPTSIIFNESIWKREFSKAPLEISNVIASSGKKFLEHGKFEFLTPDIRNHWQKQLLRNTDEDFEIPGNDYKWRIDLNLLDRISDRFDLAMWQRIANHRGYYVLESLKWQDGKQMISTNHYFIVRLVAAEIINRHGHPFESSLPDIIEISTKPYKK